MPDLNFIEMVRLHFVERYCLYRRSYIKITCANILLSTRDLFLIIGVSGSYRKINRTSDNRVIGVGCDRLSRRGRRQAQPPWAATGSATVGGDRLSRRGQRQAQPPWAATGSANADRFTDVGFDRLSHRGLRQAQPPPTASPTLASTGSATADRFTGASVVVRMEIARPTSSWFSVLSSRFSVLGSQFSVLGSSTP